MEVTTEMIKELRTATNAGVLDCRKALQENGGDLDKAIQYLRERGLAAEGKQPERVNPIMNGMIAAFDEGQMRDLAAYFAAQTQKNETAKNRETIELGQKLYRAGDQAKGLPACAACHGPAGAGIPAQFPRIGGQFALKFIRATNSVDATLIVEGSYASTNDSEWIGFATNIAGSWGSATNVFEGPGPGPQLMDVTAFDVAPGLQDDAREVLVFLLVAQDVEALHERQAGVDHHRELARAGPGDFDAVVPGHGGRLGHCARVVRRRQSLGQTPHHLRQSGCRLAASSSSGNGFGAARALHKATPSTV